MADTEFFPISYCDAPLWLGDADDGVRRVAGDANGLLLQQLLKASGYVDAA